MIADGIGGVGVGGVTAALMILVYSPPLETAGDGVPIGDTRSGGAPPPMNGDAPASGGTTGA
jgi:hypothetical protein